VAGVPDLPRLSLVYAVSVEVGLGVQVVVGHLLVQAKVLHTHGLEMWMVTIRQGRVHLMHGHGVHAGHLVLLLPFHPPVLEPDFYLSFCETQGVRNLNPASSSKVAIKMKFFF